MQTSGVVILSTLSAIGVVVGLTSLRSSRQSSTEQGNRSSIPTNLLASLWSPSETEKQTRSHLERITYINEKIEKALIRQVCHCYQTFFQINLLQKNKTVADLQAIDKVVEKALQDFLDCQNKIVPNTPSASLSTRLSQWLFSSISIDIDAVSNPQTCLFHFTTQASAYTQNIQQLIITTGELSKEMRTYDPTLKEEDSGGEQTDDISVEQWKLISDKNWRLIHNTLLSTLIYRSLQCYQAFIQIYQHEYPDHSQEWKTLINFSDIDQVVGSALQDFVSCRHRIYAGCFSQFKVLKNQLEETFKEPISLDINLISNSENCLKHFIQQAPAETQKIQSLIFKMEEIFRKHLEYQLSPTCTEDMGKFVQHKVFTILSKIYEQNGACGECGHLKSVNTQPHHPPKD
jgi:hypothetical protein